MRLDKIPKKFCQNCGAPVIIAAVKKAVGPVMTINGVPSVVLDYAPTYRVVAVLKSANPVVYDVTAVTKPNCAPLHKCGFRAVS